ncbi:MAG: hypothetical protein AAF927_29910 [Bacteroidota bacterium]
MKSLLLILASYCFLTSPDTPTVNNIIKEVPDELINTTLLLPRFVEYTKESAPEGMPESYIKVNNREAKRCNETMLEMAKKNYPFKVKLVDFSEIEEYRKQGYRYYLDMVLMPKQMEEPKKEVMVPSFVKYKSPQHMFTNVYVQFHYYYYIRDLETNDAYITTRLKGNEEAFVGINKFFKQLTKDLAN